MNYRAMEHVDSQNHDPSEFCECCGAQLVRGLCWDPDCLELRQRVADDAADERKSA